MPTTCVTCHAAVVLESLLVEAGADCVHSAGRRVSQGRGVVVPEEVMARQVEEDGEGEAIQ